MIARTLDESGVLLSWQQEGHRRSVARRRVEAFGSWPSAYRLAVQLVQLFAGSRRV